MAIFLISDTHFGHSNIIKFERKEFETIEQHDQAIIRNWNAKITDNDIVYHLGDVGLTRGDYLKNIIPKLRGRKILIMGNHDIKNATKQFFLDIGFDEVYDHPIYLNSRILLSHEPAREAFENPFIYNIHGHLHGSILTLKNFINISCKYTKYGPIHIDKILKKIPPLKKREERFLEEWYAPFYKFDDGTNRKDLKTDEDGVILFEKSRKMRFEFSKNPETKISENDYLTFVGLPLDESVKPKLQICEKFNDVYHQVTPVAKVIKIENEQITCKYHGHEYTFRNEEIGKLAWKYQNPKGREAAEGEFE